MTRSPQTPPTSADPAVNTSRIDSCWICGDSAIEERERIALAVQQRHDDGSSFGRQWTNHHGLMRCDCDELVEFIRGRDKNFWDGMNRSLEQAEGPDEIYQGRLDRDARNYPSKSEMTHDELLYELRLCDADDCGCPKAYRYSKALCAVVELHKPVAFVNEKGLFCDNCLPDRYPCTTIQAIEKELS